jgi:hypothetical protein
VYLNTSAILKMELMNLIVIMIEMGALLIFHSISSRTWIVALGFGYIASYIYAKRHYHISVKATMKSTVDSLKENYNYGKWMILGCTSSLLQERGYKYISTVKKHGMNVISAIHDVFAGKTLLLQLG